MRNKYAPTGKKQPGEGGHGRYVDPNRWKTGPDPVTRDKYYAFLKHKSQAAYRGEDHSLTWEQWQDYWSDDHWLRRGKLIDDLVLGRVDWREGWHRDNCKIMTRGEHFKIRSQNVQSRL